MTPVHGNAAVVGLLERCLRCAREGKLNYAAVTLLDGATAVSAFAGDNEMEGLAAHKVRDLREGLLDSIDNRHPPWRDYGTGADGVCYNLARGPASYDFLVWLVDAEMTRIREGAPAPLKVGFWFGADGKAGLDHPGRRQMLDHVMRPALALIGAVEEPDAVYGHCKEWYTPRDIVAASLAGEPVPRFWAWTDLKARPGAVTITLREAAHWPHRNSNLSAWLQFACHLEARGERVIFVRDTCRGGEPMPAGFDICPPASRDLRWRMALYQSAKANLFVANGPATLAHFSKRPWLQFINLDPADSFPANTPQFWAASMGIAQGEQLPWSAPNQRIVWARDSYENIVQAWQAHIA